jgi:YHS domain-containing protein
MSIENFTKEKGSCPECGGKNLDFLVSNLVTTDYSNSILDPGIAIDPVCGRKVKRQSTKYFLKNKEEIYYFCSAKCRFAYLEYLRNEVKDRDRGFPIRFTG